MKPEKRAQMVARRLSWDKFNDEDLFHLSEEIRAAERAAAEAARERIAKHFDRHADINQLSGRVVTSVIRALPLEASDG